MLSEADRRLREEEAKVSLGARRTDVAAGGLLRGMRGLGANCTAVWGRSVPWAAYQRWHRVGGGSGAAGEGRREGEGTSGVVVPCTGGRRISDGSPG